jgi:hypothetical protein
MAKEYPISVSLAAEEIYSSKAMLADIEPTS